MSHTYPRITEKPIDPQRVREASRQMCRTVDHLNSLTADMKQERLATERLLAQGRRYQQTGDARAFRDIVITIIAAGGP